MRDRRGDWQQTFRGRFWPLDPRPEEVDVRDLAHGLALLCRFAGACRVPYSVAEHSVRVSWRVEAMGGDALAALLHDASEAYTVDVPRPLKLSLPAYKVIEAQVARAVEVWAGLSAGALDAPAIKAADATLLMTEKRDLMAPPPAPWGFAQGRPEAPLSSSIRPWGWREAELRFLARYHALRGERGGTLRTLRARPDLLLALPAWGWHALVDAVAARVNKPRGASVPSAGGTF